MLRFELAEVRRSVGPLFSARFMHAEADETSGCPHLGIGMK